MKKQSTFHLIPSISNYFFTFSKLRLELGLKPLDANHQQPPLLDNMKTDQV